MTEGQCIVPEETGKGMSPSPGSGRLGADLCVPSGGEVGLWGGRGDPAGTTHG